MKFCTYDDSTANDKDQLKTTMQPPTPTMNISCFNATCIFQDQGMSNYLPFYILEKDDFTMVHPVWIRFVHLAMVCWLPSLSAHRTMACIFGCMWLVPPACTNEVWSPNPYLLHLLSVLQLTTTMVLHVRTMHYRRHQKQTAGCRLLLLCPPYCLQWLVTTSSRANMAALLLPGPGPGRAFQMVTNTHCRPKSLSNFATPPFRPIIYMVFQGKDVFFTVSYAL